MPRRRWRSSPSGKSKLRRTLWIAGLILTLLSIQFYLYVDRSLMPPLEHLASVRLKQEATRVINSAITERVSGQTDFEKLMDWRTDKNGKITGLMLNYSEQMKITSETARLVQQQLDRMAQIPEHIPLGLALNSPILASFGPDIPVKLVPAGAVKVDLNTRYQNAGINMILIEVYVKIRVEVHVIIPFDSLPEVVETEMPISYSLVVGDVPTYYFDGSGNKVGQSNPMPPGVSLPQLKFGENQQQTVEESLPSK